MNKTRRGTDPRTLLIDKAANLGITVGGLAIVAAVLGIFVFIFLTILPLLKGATGGLSKALPAPGAVYALADEHKEKALLILGDGKLAVLDLAGGATSPLPLPGPGAKVKAVRQAEAKGMLALELADGKRALAEAGFNTRFDGEGRRHQDPYFRLHPPAEGAESPVPAAQALPEGEGLGTLGWILGGQSVVLGGAKGSVLALARLQKGEDVEYPAFHRFEPMPAAATHFSASPRDKGFALADAKGNLRIYHLTSERTVLNLALPGPADSLQFTPKADGLLALSGGRAHLFDVHNPHPETTLKTLFGKVWYEGYDGPEYVWQSSGGSDDFEPKFSLTPLIYGTLKGTFYALLFAVPLAILAALYVSQFMSRGLKALVKPAVEIMAALPSVVMGFLAALLLAPLVEKHLFTIFLGALATPLVVLATLALWRALPRGMTRLFREENELWVLIAGLALGLGLVGLLGGGIERALFTDFKVWIAANFGVTYDQRNSLVVGFAMGFAVIPIIFTICEDALSSVPRHLVSASLSCGATPWQTATRVVLPVALSGIFSAVMIGFGRAVGETMIVLMATGNTPVMDFSMFSGFRALSANIAVEIPEAPLGGTLYRVLFLAALVLFLMTFAVNTVAELVRLQLRRKYSQL